MNKENEGNLTLNLQFFESIYTQLESVDFQNYII